MEFRLNERSWEMTPGEIGAEFEKEKTLNEIMAAGRGVEEARGRLDLEVVDHPVRALHLPLRGVGGPLDVHVVLGGLLQAELFDQRDKGVPLQQLGDRPEPVILAE